MWLFVVFVTSVTATLQQVIYKSLPYKGFWRGVCIGGGFVLFFSLDCLQPGKEQTKSKPKQINIPNQANKTKTQTRTTVYLCVVILVFNIFSLSNITKFRLTGQRGSLIVFSPLFCQVHKLQTESPFQTEFVKQELLNGSQ